MSANNSQRKSKQKNGLKLGEEINNDQHKSISYGHQSITEDDCKAVYSALKEEYLTTGPNVKKFEGEFAAHVGAKYAVSVNNGTSALHLAYLAAGLSMGDEIITTPMTFCATSNCAFYCNAIPIFADITDDMSGLIDPVEIKKKLTSKTKIIAPMHYAGQPCDMEEIKSIADNINKSAKKIYIIEDASHALGAEYKGTKIGSCAYSDMSTFSFHPVKHITTGEGGIVTTNSKDLYEKMLIIRNHGIIHEKSLLKDKIDGPWHHEMQMLGYNFRITDFQCALGISQLKRIESFLKSRSIIAEKYNSSFKNNVNITPIKQLSERKNAFHLYVIAVDNKKIRLLLYHYLKENNIFCQVHYLPVYLHPYYIDLGYKYGQCQNSERFYEKILSIPIYPNLKEEELDYVISKINNFFEGKIE
jgi:UDP-4-amino-4,6-dideoxy-N-acetyl-beta-L-altrosamine transaminase